MYLLKKESHFKSLDKNTRTRVFIYFHHCAASPLPTALRVSSDQRLPAFWHRLAARCSLVPVLMFAVIFDWKIKQDISSWEFRKKTRLCLINTSQRGGELVCSKRITLFTEKMGVTWIDQERDDSSGETGSR